MELVRSIVESLKSYDALLWWVFAASVAMFLLTPVIVAWAVVWLPKDYFTSERRRAAGWSKTHPWLAPVIVVVKNLAGVVLVLAGLVMLVVPGQGVLTLVVGLVLIDFPGKFRLVKWLATRRGVWRSINWLRKRAGREPLERPQ